MKLGLGTYAVIATAVLHGGLAAAIATIDRDDPPVPTVITIVETPKKHAPPPPTPPPPPPPQAPAVKAPLPPRPASPPPRRAAPAPPAAAAPAGPPPPPDFGVKLGGPSGDGPALPAAAPAQPAAPPPPTEHKELHAAAAQDGCSDPIVKPKPIHVVQPAFTQEAIDASVSGKVRVEIAISATGEITGARVIEGLGHGLDEAALEAARASTFEPATRCGQAVATTFTIGMRFTR